MKNEAVTTAAASDQLFMRVTDAARLLGISRSHAYDMANQWIETNGETGIPAVRLGRRLLVNRQALREWANSWEAPLAGER